MDIWRHTVIHRIEDGVRIDLEATPRDNQEIGILRPIVDSNHRLLAAVAAVFRLTRPSP